MKYLANLTRVRRPFLLAIATCLIALPMIGCSNSSISEIEDLETVSLYSNTDQLAQTLEYVRSLNRYEMTNFRDKVNSGLNRWADSVDSMAPDWKQTEMISDLPPAIQDGTIISNLDNSTFFSNDADYVQQIFWMKKIAERIAPSNFIFHQEYLFQTARKMADQATLDRWAEESDDLLLDGLRLIHDELTDEDDARIKALAQTIKLFDWTVRNVHLIEARPWPTPEIVKTEAMNISADPNSFPPAAGAAGPGYIRNPWQVFTYAKGDYLERARVFAGLCHQINVPMAVLANPIESASEDESKTARPYQEWLCGVAIGGEIYLFDPKLGMPIHGKRPGSIATLKEVKANPELLTDLGLSVDESIEKIDYRISADQLDDLIALVVAPPESLSRRMEGMENNLTGDSRLKLTMDPSKIADTFNAIDGIKDTKLWHAPFSNALFREQVAYASATRFDAEVRSRLLWLDQEEKYIDLFVQFRTARNCFLQGVFRSDKEKDIRSALSYYYSFMYTDAEIDFIERDELKQRSLGILRDVNQSFAEWQEQLLYMKTSMGVIRADAAFFLSMCNYENNMPPTSLKWLKRISNYDDEKRWSDYSPYHLGRAYESSGEYAEAAKAYAADTSPQKQGSIIRKLWMEKLQSETSSKP